MSARLAGKVFVVSGSASGIGFGVTNRFASEGARVVACDIDKRLSDQAWESAGGGAVETHVGDIGVGADCAAIVGRAEQLWGRLDGLVNCAGIAPRSPLETMDDATWDRVIATNLRGAFLLSKHAVIAIRHHADGGTLLHIGSVAGLAGIPNLSAYSASKGGVIALVRQLSIELAPLGIRVNCVCPGATDTPAFHSRTDLLDAVAVAQARNSFPLLKFHQRLIQPSEIAEAVMFLSSDESRMITGAVLPVDGGYLAQ